MNVVRYIAKLHWIVYVIPTVGILLCSPGILFFFVRDAYVLRAILLIPLLIMLNCIRILLIKLSTRIIVFDGIIQLRSGILMKNTHDIYLWSVKSVNVNYPLGQSVKLGTVSITSGDLLYNFRLANPDDFVKEVNKQLNEIWT